MSTSETTKAIIDAVLCCNEDIAFDTNRHKGQPKWACIILYIDQSKNERHLAIFTHSEFLDEVDTELYFRRNAPDYWKFYKLLCVLPTDGFIYNIRDGRRVFDSLDTEAELQLPKETEDEIQDAENQGN